MDKKFDFLPLSHYSREEHNSFLSLENADAEEVLFDVADLFKVFGDGTRTKILFSLYKKEKTVSELASGLNMSLSAVSHQLRVLKSAKLVKGERSGKEIIYSLDDDHVLTIINCAISHVLGENCQD